jgi:hypothetical protein
MLYYSEVQFLYVYKPSLPRETVIKYKMTKDGYAVYVTAHMLDDNPQFLDEHWELAEFTYKHFLVSEFNINTRSEYDCIYAYIEHLKRA